MEQKLAAVREARKGKDIFIAAHLYQPQELSYAADFTGDTLEIVKEAIKSSAKTVIVCAVRFIAEMIKIMAPEKRVILAHPEATCPMANQILPARLRAYKEENEDICIVAYVNTNARVKAECDICVSTATAADICSELEGRRILFVPDRNIAEGIRKKTGKNIETWNCCCPIHDSVTLRDIELARQMWPNAKIAVHLGCRSEVVENADFAGSAGQLMEWCAEQDEVVIAAESSIAPRLNEMYPEKVFHSLMPEKLTCNHMERTSLDTLLRVINEEYGEIIEIEDTIAQKARATLRHLF